MIREDQPVFFFRNGKFIEENEKYILKGSNTELTVRNIINSDGGPYVCRATNKAGEDEKQAFLQVFGKYYSIVVKTIIRKYKINIFHIYQEAYCFILGTLGNLRTTKFFFFN